MGAGGGSKSIHLPCCAHPLSLPVLGACDNVWTFLVVTEGGCCQASIERPELQ